MTEFSSKSCPRYTLQPQDFFASQPANPSLRTGVNGVKLISGASAMSAAGILDSSELFSNGILCVNYVVTLGSYSNQSENVTASPTGCYNTTIGDVASNLSASISGISGYTISNACPYAGTLNLSVPSPVTSATVGTNSTDKINSVLLSAIGDLPDVPIGKAISLLNYAKYTCFSKVDSMVKYAGNPASRMVFENLTVMPSSGNYSKKIECSGLDTSTTNFFGSNILASEMVMNIRINASSFSTVGELKLSGSNLMGCHGFTIGSSEIAKKSIFGNGASTLVIVPLVPAYTLAGVLENNGDPAPHQEMVIVQSNPVNGNTTYFYEKTGSSGSFLFFAKPGDSYQISEVTPTGLSQSAISTGLLSGEGGKFYTLNVNETSISGYVNDPGAFVELTNPSGAVLETATANAYGGYTFNGIADTGTYNIGAYYQKSTSGTSVDVTSLNGGQVVVPQGVGYTTPFTVYNNQSLSTPAPFDLEVTVDSSLYSPYEASNLQNVVWFLGNGSLIPSWIQSGDSSSSTGTVYWLKLPFGLEAYPLIYSSAHIYMGFAATGTNEFLSGYEGVAPQLTSPYAIYDNGYSVFDLYDNFAGTSLSSLWNLKNDGANTVSVDNHLYMDSQYALASAGISSVNPIAGPAIAEAYVSQYAYNAGGPSYRSIAESNSNVFTQLNYGGFAYGDGYAVTSADSGGPHPVLSVSDANGTGASLGTSANSFPGIVGISWASNGSEFSYYNGVLDQTSTNSINSYPGHLYISLGLGTGGAGAGSMTWQWVRVRQMPPNNVMPALAMGSGSSTGSPPYSSGYSASRINIPPPDGSVTFVANNLPSGSAWTLDFGGTDHSTTSTIIGLSEPYGTYQYTITPPADYSASPSFGSVTVGSAAQTIDISFTQNSPPPSTYSVRFSESGLPSGTQWAVSLGGHEETGTGSSISFSESSGSYSYSVYAASSGSTIYSPVPSSGTVYVSGNVNTGITYSANSGGGGGGGCILNGTLVTVSWNRYLPVQDLSVGDRVLSYDPLTGHFINNRITAINVTEVHSILSINNGLLYVSGLTDQPIYVLTPNGTAQWIMAGNLSTSDYILDPQMGIWVPVFSLQVEYGNYTVYDLHGEKMFYQSGYMRFTYMANGLLLDRKI